jgi:hypothetical protein
MSGSRCAVGSHILEGSIVCVPSHALSAKNGWLLPLNGVFLALETMARPFFFKGFFSVNAT